MKKTPKEFALEQIAPYYKNPELCGYENGVCKYKTKDGKMCVAGKNMNDAFVEGREGASTSIDCLLENHGFSQKDIFKEDAAYILTAYQWGRLQSLHDNIAGRAKDEELNAICDKIGLFTLDELKEYCK